MCTSQEIFAIILLKNGGETSHDLHGIVVLIMLTKDPMLSVKAIYEAGHLKILEPVDIKKSAVIVTFLDDHIPFVEKAESEDFFQKLRKHKRFKAKGDIVILVDGEESLYPLYDYSGGGLSFFSETPFEAGKDITAIIRYRAAGEMLAMDFQIAVRRSEPENEKFKTGCQFYDSVDEDLWHTIME